MNGAVEQIRTLSQMRELAQALTGRERCAAVTGLAPVHRAMVTAAVLAEVKRPVVLLCADETEADRLAEDLTAFTGQAVRRLSARDFTFHNAAVVSRQWEHRRLSALRALGDVLGRYELQEQLESIDICLDSLNRSMHGLQTQYPERRRLVLGLSAAAGILVLIVLI